MDTLAYVIEKYGLTLGKRSPIEIPNIGRDNLPELFRELEFIEGAEIGVEQGVYSEILCQGVPNLRLHCVDAWTTYKGYRDHVSQEKLDSFYQATEQRLAPYDVDLIRAFSMDALERIRDNWLDFVYIDANHEIPYVIDDICAWARKVRKGGIIAGHDYKESRRPITHNHVVPALNCVMRAWRVHPWFLVGVRAKTPGTIRDKSRSWFWVKGSEFAYRL